MFNDLNLLKISTTTCVSQVHNRNDMHKSITSVMHQNHFHELGSITLLHVQVVLQTSTWPALCGRRVSNKFDSHRAPTISVKETISLRQIFQNDKHFALFITLWWPHETTTQDASWSISYTMSFIWSQIAEPNSTLEQLILKCNDNLSFGQDWFTIDLTMSYKVRSYIPHPNGPTFGCFGGYSNSGTIHIASHGYRG